MKWVDDGSVSGACVAGIMAFLGTTATILTIMGACGAFTDGSRDRVDKLEESKQDGIEAKKSDATSGPDSAQT